MNKLLLVLVFAIIITGGGVILALDYIHEQEVIIESGKKRVAELKELTKPPITEKIYSQHEKIDEYLQDPNNKYLQEHGYINVTYSEAYNGDGKLIGGSLQVLQLKNPQLTDEEFDKVIGNTIQIRTKNPNLLSDEEIDILISQAVGKGYGGFIDIEQDEKAQQILWKILSSGVLRD